jgi:predicted transglutaminase-like cysteine proteinase
MVMGGWLYRVSGFIAGAILLSGCASNQLAEGGYGVRESASAAIASDLPTPSSAMPVRDVVAPPSGFVSFCFRFPDQCGKPSDPASTFSLTAQNWSLLNRVNEQVNESIAPEDDYRHFGRAEYWTIPTDGRGNCHDYALTKRAQLISAGVPELALRIAVVETPWGERHAVLTVATDKGDYVLDNLRGEIRPWQDADYTWIERQGASSAWQWVALSGNADLQTASLTSSTTSQ